MEEGRCAISDIVRDGNSDKGTLEWKSKLKEKNIQIYVIRIFRVDELISAKVVRQKNIHCV